MTAEEAFLQAWPGGQMLDLLGARCSAWNLGCPHLQPLRARLKLTLLSQATAGCVIVELPNLGRVLGLLFYCTLPVPQPPSSGYIFTVEV